MSRKISERDYKLLYGRSAGRCNICNKEVFLPKKNGEGVTHTGEMAHAYPYSRKQTAPRFTEGKPLDNSYNNLILLCSYDHDIVDEDTDFYTIEKLREIKNTFEERIRSLLGDLKPDFFFVDLINKNIKFQYLLANLNDPLYSLPFDMTDIGDVENYLLPYYMPTYFPFDDQRLTDSLSKIISSYRELYNCTYPYYDIRDPLTLKLMNPDYVYQNQSLVIQIKSSAKELSDAIYYWIQYCRELNFINR